MCQFYSTFIHSPGTFGKLTLGLFSCGVFPDCMVVKMLLVFHPLCNRVIVSLWFIVSQCMSVTIYISVKVQLKCITVAFPYHL